MKNILLLCALALFNAGLALAEPEYVFKFTGFVSQVGQLVSTTALYTDTKPIDDATAISMCNGSMSPFLSDFGWKIYKVNSWAEYYAMLSKPETKMAVSVPASGEFIILPNSGSVTSEKTYGCGNAIVFPQGIAPGKPYTLYSTPGLPKQDPAEDFYFTADFSDLMFVESGYLKTDPLPEPAFALVALIGLLAVCRKK